MTVLGPCPCRDCGTVVYVQRRTFVFTCKAHGRRRRLCTSESLELTVVEESGERHLCPAAERREVAAA